MKGQTPLAPFSHGRCVGVGSDRSWKSHVEESPKEKPLTFLWTSVVTGQVTVKAWSEQARRTQSGVKCVQFLPFSPQKEVLAEAPEIDLERKLEIKRHNSGDPMAGAVYV